MSINSQITSPGFVRQIGASVLGLCLAAGMAACQSTSPMESESQRSTQYADDGALTTAVKSKFASEGSNTLNRINVTTNGGIVQLSGTVDTSEQKEEASRLAGQVNGVRKVNNGVQVRRSEVSGQPDRVLQ